MPKQAAEMTKSTCRLLALYIPIMDTTDRFVSKVNAVNDDKVAVACVTVADVSKVNAVPSCPKLA